MTAPSDTVCCQATCASFTCEAPGFVKKNGTDTVTNPDDSKCCEADENWTYDGNLANAKKGDLQVMVNKLSSDVDKVVARYHPQSGNNADTVVNVFNVGDQ